MSSLQRCGYALLPVAACSLFAGSSAAVALPVPIVTEPEGKITLAELAGGDISLSGDRAVDARSFGFNFPLDAEQGPDTWYLIRLDASVTFAPHSGPGSVLISGFSRGQAGAQVEFFPGRTESGKAFVTWGSVDLIRGQAEGRSSGSEASVRYRNYLPFKGVEPGPANLTFQLERLGEAEVTEVRIGPASGIYATPAGPVELKLEAHTPDAGVLTTGEPTRLEVEVTNTSPRRAREVVISLQPQASHMFVDGPALRRVKDLEGSRTVEFTIGRSRPGTLRVKAVAAAANGAEALSVLEAEVDDRDAGGEGPGPWLAVGFTAAALGGVAAAALNRRRKQGGVKS